MLKQIFCMAAMTVLLTTGVNAADGKGTALAQNEETLIKIYKIEDGLVKKNKETDSSSSEDEILAIDSDSSSEDEILAKDKDSDSSSSEDEILAIDSDSSSSDSEEAALADASDEEKDKDIEDIIKEKLA